MDTNPTDAIAKILTENLTRDLVLGIQESLTVGAMRAYLAASNMRDGHLPNVLGQMRHFHMNEAFHDALTASGSVPTPLKGNSLVIGRHGILTLGRFNVAAGVWNTARRSSTRRELARQNRAIQMLVQVDLFEDPPPVSEATVFFVGAFSGSVKYQPEAPLCVYIAVPDKEMRSLLFRESITEFISRFEARPIQRDGAQPTLKTKSDKKTGTE